MTQLLLPYKERRRLHDRAYRAQQRDQSGLHERGLAHGNVKMNNIIVGAPNAPSRSDVVLIDAGTFAVMAVVAILLPTLKRSPPQMQAPLSERLGLRQLWDMKPVRYITLLSLIFFFSYGPLEAALPLYSDAVLQTDARGYGLLWSALGVGALIGTLSSTTLSRRVRSSSALPLIARANRLHAEDAANRVLPEVQPAD